MVDTVVFLHREPHDPGTFNAAESIISAATVVGAQGPSGDWRFAEGYVGSG